MGARIRPQADADADEIEQFQHEVIRVKQIVGNLYPELFSERLETEDVLI